MKTEFNQRLNTTMDEMRQEVDKMRDEIRRMKEHFTWGSWEPHNVGIVPIRVNGCWYFKGDTVYRKEKIKYLTGSKEYKYGDEFDILREQND